MFKVKKKVLIIIPVLALLMLAAFIFNSSVNTKLREGDTAPNISLGSADGSSIELSSLKGKYVLVDFWASWCGACRKENPGIVRAYNKYKDQKLNGSQGFTVYSVSLDNDAEIWKKAIKNDKMAWPNHVSALKKWDCPAASAYGVSALPSSFLIDPTGKIIATDLTGTSLETELEKLVNK
ncbi:MAG: TlpA family protein disulfide reductase [Bacteroidia bacterium]